MDTKDNNYTTKAFLLGAGFDMNFNLPSWNELVEMFGYYLISKADKDKTTLFRNINFIKKSDNTPMRKMNMLLEISKNHIEEFEKIKNDFLQDFLKNEEITPIDKDTIGKSLRGSNSLILTTNMSNTLIEFGLTPSFDNRESIYKGKFVPIHGCAFDAENKNDESFMKPIILEYDYLENQYKKRIETIKFIIDSLEINEIHIFGYSMNDVQLLSQLINTNITKFVIYRIKSKNKSKEIEIQYLKSLIGRDNRTCYIEDEFDDYEFLFKRLVSELDKSTENSPYYFEDWSKENKNTGEINAIEKIINDNSVRIESRIENFVDGISENKKININKLIIQLEEKINQKFNFKLIIALEKISNKFLKEIKDANLSETLKLAIKKHMNSKKIDSFEKLVKNIGNLDLSKEYLKTTGNLHFLNHINWTGKRENTENWLNWIKELLKEKEIVYKIIQTIIKTYKNPVILNWLNGYNDRDVFTNVRSQIFIAMLTTIKSNKKYFEIHLREKEIEEIDNKIPLNFYYDVMKLAKLIFKNKKEKIKKLKTIETIAWFADKSPKELEELKDKEGKIPRYIADALYIPTRSDLRNNKYDFMVSTITLQDIVEENNLEKYSSNKIFDKIINKEISLFDLRYVLEFLIKRGETTDWFVKKINKNKNFEYINIIIECLFKENNEGLVNFLRKNNWSFIHVNHWHNIEDKINIRDVKVLKKILLTMNFQNSYSYNDAFNCIECLIVKKVMSILKNEVDGTNKMINWLKSLNYKVEEKGFKGFINGMLFIYNAEFDEKENDANFLKSFYVATTHFKINVESIIKTQFIKVFKTYLEVSSEDELKKDSHIWGYLLVLLKWKEWSEIKDIVKKISECPKIIKRESWLFEKEFDFKNIPSYEEIKKNKFFIELTKEFIRWFVNLSAYKMVPEIEKYDLDFIIKLIKKDAKYNISTIDFWIFVKFCEQNSFNQQEIENVIFKLVNSNPKVHSAQIDFSMIEDFNHILWLKNNLEEKVLKKFNNFLDKNEIEIPKELAEY